MDLGFGASNQVIGNVASQAVLLAHRAQEEAIESEIAKYDSLLNANDEELEALREKRLRNMRKAHEQEQIWKSLDHGKYMALEGSDTAKGFFETTKKSECVVVHFHRRTTRLCDVFHKHLEKLVINHLETRFVKIDVEGGGDGVQYLVEKLGIVVMPTLLIIKNRKAVHQIRGFDEMGGSENFRTEVLEYVLGIHGAINKNDDGVIPEEFNTRSSNSIRISRGSTDVVRRGSQKSIYFEDFED